MIHQQPHPLAGKKVQIKNGDLAGKEYHVEDYWDRVSGVSWMNANGNPACLNYAMRSGLQDFKVPTNNEVLYGKIGSFGHLIHVTELAQ